MYLLIFSIALLGLCLGTTDVVYRLEHRDRLSQPGVSQRYTHHASNLEMRGLDGRQFEDAYHLHEKDSYVFHVQREHLYPRDASLLPTLSRRQLCQRDPMGQCISSPNSRNSQVPLLRTSSALLGPGTGLNTAGSLGRASMGAESMFASASLASASIGTVPPFRWRPWPQPPAPPPSPRSRAASRAGSVASFASFADWRGPARLSSGDQSDETTHSDSPRRLSISQQPPAQPGSGSGSGSSSQPLSRPSMRGILRTSKSYHALPATPAFGMSRRPSGAMSHSGSVGRLSRAGSPSLPGAASSLGSSGHVSGHESADSERETHSVVYVSPGSSQTFKNKAVRIRAASGYVGIFFSGHDFITGTNASPGSLKIAFREGAAEARAAGSVTRIEAFAPDSTSQRFLNTQIAHEFPTIQPIVYLYPSERSGHNIFEALPRNRGSPPLIRSTWAPHG